MPYEIVRNDITKMRVDAIVNAANHTLLGGGGVDGAIHRAAGPKLLEECRGLGGCETGHAKITKGYRLHAKYVIHTVGPVWHGGNNGEEALLTSCYDESLRLAGEHGCKSVAFPLISAGAYGYPVRDAMRIALERIQAYLLGHDEMMVYLVIFGKSAMSAGSALFTGIKEYIDDNYAGSAYSEEERRRRRFGWFGLHRESGPVHYAEREADEETETAEEARSESIAEDYSAEPEDLSWNTSGYASTAYPTDMPASNAAKQSVAPPAAGGQGFHIGAAKRPKDFHEELDESFCDMLLRKIDESGMSDSDCYHKANVSKQVFSKIKNQKGYRPTKPTVCAFAVALRLDLVETSEMLNKAGYALSHSFLFDVIVEYFIKRGHYDVFDINETLFDFDQPLLGGKPV